MRTKRILLALFLIYFVFAILLNSVGTVILQVIGNYGVSKSGASILEAFKDLPIAVVSFLVASFLAGLSAFTFLLVLSTPFDERSAQPPAGRSRLEDFTAMLRLFFRPLVCVFVMTAFLYVLIEQSVGTWLPTFNNEILKLPAAMSVEVTSIFAASLALGRLGAGLVMRRLNWSR